MKQPNDTVADREFLSTESKLTIAAGAWDGVTHVNKFGYAPDGAQTTATDIWDRADAAATQQIYTVSATSGVIHQIKSTSAADGYGIGAGAEKVRIYGLKDWDSKETWEDIELNGTTGVTTANTYVIIHRMKVIEYGTVGVNLGAITCKILVGATIAAQINIGEGQTQMAIYGVPSVQTAYLTNWYASIHNRTSSTATCKLLVSADPKNSPSIFVTKETRGLCSDGTSSETWEKNPYNKFPGPCIFKVQAQASAADQDMGAGFDLILVDN